MAKRKMVTERRVIEAGSVHHVIEQLSQYLDRDATVYAADYDEGLSVQWERPETDEEFLARRLEEIARRRRDAYMKKWNKERQKGLAAALIKARNLSPAEAREREREQEELKAARTTEEYVLLRERQLRDRDNRYRLATEPTVFIDGGR